MGKRSNFPRFKLDDYPTPKAAVGFLLPHIPMGSTFIEPCAGSGALTSHLVEAGLYRVASLDISTGWDAISQVYEYKADFFITNPPWSRNILHPIILNLSRQKPTWLLFDADWAHTKQAAPYLQFCRKIVSIGRLKWIQGSPYTGKDNCCWYFFTSEKSPPTIFIGR